MKTTNEKVIEMKAQIMNGEGWIQYDYIFETWMNMFNEYLERSEMITIARMLIAIGVPVENLPTKQQRYEKGNNKNQECNQNCPSFKIKGR